MTTMRKMPSSNRAWKREELCMSLTKPKWWVLVSMPLQTTKKTSPNLRKIKHSHLPKRAKDLSSTRKTTQNPIKELLSVWRSPTISMD
jgi:hypothetical protein